MSGGVSGFASQESEKKSEDDNETKGDGDINNSGCSCLLQESGPVDTPKEEGEETVETAEKADESVEKEEESTSKNRETKFRKNLTTYIERGKETSINQM